MKSMAAYNGREIPKEDKVFAVVARAAEAIAKHGRENVINGTAGALYDDSGELIVLKSVDRVMKSLAPADYAAYAPIAGTVEFRKAIMKAALGDFEPKSFAAAVATPGGTAAVRNVIANYSQPGDRILTHSWHWAPYATIAGELYRGIERFEMFDGDGRFNITDFEYKVSKLVRNQEHLVVILNTPANNPTGYALSAEDWLEVKRVMDSIPSEKKVALLLDVAYLDYAGEPAKVREFFGIIDNLRSNILPIIAYSASKTFTFYGARCAAMICLAHSPEVADEFVSINSFSARNTWSNPPRGPQEVIARIYADSALLAEVEAERAEARAMLLSRGRAFEKAAAECGLRTVPFSAGFFITIPHDDPEALCRELEKKNIFFIPFENPMTHGARIAISSIPEEDCRRLPAIIKETMAEMAVSGEE